MVGKTPRDWADTPCLRQFLKEPKPLKLRRRGRWLLPSQLRLRPRHEDRLTRLRFPHRLLNLQRWRLKRTFHHAWHWLTGERVSRTAAAALAVVAPIAAAAAVPIVAAAAAAATTAATTAAAAAAPSSAAAAVAATTAAPAPTVAAAPPARPRTRRPA